jgi:hypothetical protein
LLFAFYQATATTKPFSLKQVGVCMLSGVEENRYATYWQAVKMFLDENFE